jgi:hypothetical protein
MEEDNAIIGACLVPFFSDVSGRNFVVLKKKGGKTDFIGGLADFKRSKSESAVEAIMRLAKKEISMFIIPHPDEAADFKKKPIQESLDIILDLPDTDIETTLNYLNSYWNTAKEVFAPNDEKTASWIIAYAFVVEVESNLDAEILRGWFRAGSGIDDLVILEIKNEKPELSDNYQFEIYNDALRYLKGYLNASYGIIS